MNLSLFEQEARSLRPLRPRQIAAIEQVKAAIREGHKRIVLQAPTGFGKTLTAAHIIAGALHKGRRPLFTCPAITLVEQTLKSFEGEGLHDVGIMQGNHHRTDRDASLQIASVQTLVRREAPSSDFALVDECFPAGTPVAIPGGTVAIENLRSGDAVMSATGIDRVVSLFSKTQEQFVKVRLSNGDNFRCTPDHPIFTIDGWTKAGQLEARTRVFGEEELRTLWFGIPPHLDQKWGSCWHPGIGMQVYQAQILRELLCQEIRESNVPTGSARGSIAIAEEDRPSAVIAGRQWQRDDKNTEFSAAQIGRGMGVRIRREDGTETREWVPSPLQARLSELFDDGLYRVGRRESRVHDAARAGSEEGCVAPRTWVESVEIEEQSCAEPVYNLRVARHPSYFANGILVHNCHEEFDGLYAMLATEAWKERIVIGLSATPWTKGMGLRWTKLIIAATINELIADGHATPTIMYGPSHDIDRGDIKITAGEFDEGQSAEAMSTATVIGDVIEEWKAKSTGEKTFMFCVNRKHAQAQMHAFLDCGVPFGYIDGNTPMGERDNQVGTRLHAFAQMSRGDIAGISSVGCLIRGVDEDVRCIVDLQMTNSEMRHVQKWGRGVRTAPGKTHLIGLDHAGNNLDLGLFTDIFHDTLDTRKKEERGEAFKGDNKAAKPRKCPQCRQIVPPERKTCAKCGAQMPLLPHGVKTVNGRLVELGANYEAEQKGRQAFYSSMLWIAKDKGFKEGWAKVRYKEQYGAWPNGLTLKPRKPSEDILKAERQRYNEYRKAKAAQPQPAAEEYAGEF